MTVASLQTIKGLGALSNLVFAALTAQLPEAAAKVSAALEHRAGQATDCLEMLSALPPIADVLRYGKAREVDTGQMSMLFDRIAVQASIALHHASRGLDEEAAGLLRDAIREADRAMQLLDSSSRGIWLQSLRDVVDDAQSTALVAGQAARLLYEGEQINSEEVVVLLARRLSPGTTTSAAAGFFEGFLDGAGERLIRDWVLSLDEQTFVESLPLFRRVFSSLDKMERQRLMAAVLGRETQHQGYEVSEGFASHWPEQMQTIARILKGVATDG